VDITWSDAADSVEFSPPDGAEILARANPSGKPVAVEFRLGGGRVCFLGAELARAIAVLNRRPRTVSIDGQKSSAPLLSRYGKHALVLPHGTHEVVIVSP